MSKQRKVPLRRQLSNFAYSMKIVWAHSKLLFAVYSVKAVVNGVSPAAQAYLIGSLLNELVAAAGGQTDKTKAIYLLAVSAGLQLLSFSIQALERYMFVVHRELIEMQMMGVIMEQRIVADLAYVEISETKDKYDRAISGARDTIWYVQYSMTILSSIIGIISVIAALLATVPLVLFVLLPLPLISTRLSLKNLLTNREYWDERRSHRIRAHFINDMFSKENGLIEVRLLGVGEKILKLWRKEQTQAVSVSRNKETLAAKQDLLINLLESAAGVAVDIWLVFKVFAGTISLGAFEQSRRLVSAYILSLAQLTGGVSSLILYGYSIDDYRNFLDEAQEYDIAREGKTKLKGPLQQISISNLSYKYPTGDVLALKNASMDIKAGETLAIVGQNGAGKTSLVKNLFGLYDPVEGVISYDGVSHKDLDFSSLYKDSASLMQDYWTFDFLTVGQSIALSTNQKYDRAKVNRALKIVGLDKTINDLKKGLDTSYGYIEDDGVKFSGGQGQRLAIARILYRESSLLIMDEPTSAIDAKSEQEIMDHIFDLYKKKTLVIISHRLSTVSRADKIVFMKDGEVQEVGTHKQLFKPGTGYYDLFHKQSLRIK